MARPHSPALVFQDNALLDPAKQAMLLDRIKKAGGTGIQQDVVWGNLRKNGAYDPAAMASLQNLFQAANARGLHPQVRLMGTPYYQQKANPGVDTALSATNPNVKLMGQFAGDMARAFGGQVGKYSIWNEPNIGSFLRPDLNAGQQATVNPGLYRQLYRAGYAGVKGANRNAKVGLGELTSGDPKAAGAGSTIGFLKAVLAGKKPLRTDYVAVHPYQWSNPGTHPQGMDKGFGGISNLQAVQDAIRHAYGTGKLRTATGKRPSLTLSEFGYKHDIQKNAGVRAAWMQRALQEAAQAHAGSVNMYQLLPSKKGDYWDSSIANAQGRIDPAMAAVLRRGGARARPARARK